MVNRRTGQQLEITPESAFRLDLSRLTGGSIPNTPTPPATVVDARECTLAAANQKSLGAGQGTVRTLRYHCDAGAVEVEYTLGAEDHFIRKALRFEPGFPEPYLLHRVSMQQFRLRPEAGELVPFHHGRSVTYFMRQKTGGFFFGVEVPLETAGRTPDGSLHLAYPVNYRYPGGETYVAEPAFWGVYRLTGTTAPAVPANFDECRNSKVPPDLGESRAMLDMVVRQTQPRPHAVTVNFNSWEGGLSRKGYGRAATSADIEQDKKVLLLAKEQFGEFYSNTTIPWGGMGYDMPLAGPEQTEPPASALQKEMLEWARENQIAMHTWAPLKSICPWLGIHRYAPGHEPWWGREKDVQYNCPANRPYMRWFTALLIRLMRRDGYGGYALDEGEPHPRTGLPCAAVGHDHLPGDASYGYFAARRQLFRTLRREFGRDFHLEAARPNMDAGVWDATYVDGVFTLSENSVENGDDIRYRSRIRHFYHFVPSYLDQVYFRPGAGDPDYLILSALAVSNTHIVYGVGQTEAERKRIRYWYDWARRNGEILRRPATFLPEWPVVRSIPVGGGHTGRIDVSPYEPGKERCDSYLRAGADGAGFAFFFNSNDRAAAAFIPLDARSGLDGKRRYRFRRVYPESSAGIPSTSGIVREVRVTLPARSAALLSLEPVR